MSLEYLWYLHGNPIPPTLQRLPTKFACVLTGMRSLPFPVQTIRCCKIRTMHVHNLLYLGNAAALVPFNLTRRRLIEARFWQQEILSNCEIVLRYFTSATEVSNDVGAKNNSRVCSDAVMYFNNVKWSLKGSAIGLSATCLNKEGSLDKTFYCSFLKGRCCGKYFDSDT